MRMNRTVFELIRKNASRERQIDDVSYNVGKAIWYCVICKLCQSVAYSELFFLALMFANLSTRSYKQAAWLLRFQCRLAPNCQDDIVRLMSVNITLWVWALKSYVTHSRTLDILFACFLFFANKFYMFESSRKYISRNKIKRSIITIVIELTHRDTQFNV